MQAHPLIDSNHNSPFPVFGLPNTAIYNPMSIKGQKSEWKSPNEQEKRKWDELGDSDANVHVPKLFQKEEPEDNAVFEGTPGKWIWTNGYLCLQSEEQQTRRKEQNRAAQRAFRERKERYVKELELKIETMEKEYTKNNEALKKENEELQSLVKSMEADIYTLRGAVYAFEISANKLREAGIDVPVDNNQTVSPPGSGSQRPLVVEGKVSPVQLPLSNMSYKRPGEMVLDIFSPNLGEPIYQTHVDTMIQEDVGRLPCVTESFAQSTSKRFEHEPHPDTLTGVRMIPYSQVWERLSDHPRIEEVNIEELCREMKQKAKCSGSGAVIEEEELEKVLRRLDNGA